MRCLFVLTADGYRKVNFLPDGSVIWLEFVGPPGMQSEYSSLLLETAFQCFCEFSGDLGSENKCSVLVFAWVF